MEDPVPLQAVEPKRLYRQIADQLAQLIAQGEFPPGSRLPAERELAVSLGVSRTSVREAIISLEMSGLVEVRVGTGIFVVASRPATPRQGDAGPGPFELLAARSLIEGEIAALAARCATAEDIAALEDSVTRMASGLDDFGRREAEDEAFHRLLAKATGNGSLELVVEGLWGQRAGLWTELQRHFHTADLARRTVSDHRAIVAAVAAHDAGAARDALHRHLDRVVREFERDTSPASRDATPQAAAPRASRDAVPQAAAPRASRDAAPQAAAPQPSPVNPRRSR
jgi:DNA-binding FadR family transcriptional regulator